MRFPRAWLMGTKALQRKKHVTLPLKQESEPHECGEGRALSGEIAKAK